MMLKTPRRWPIYLAVLVTGIFLGMAIDRFLTHGSQRPVLIDSEVER